MTNNILKENERLDDLQCNNLKIIQNPTAFCFGVDAVLLAHFAKIRQQDTVIDLGTGCGVIPLLLSAYTQSSSIIGYDIQPSMIDMARRSAQLNQLETRISFETIDIRNVERSEIADYITCNPPYYSVDAALQTQEPSQALARYEVQGTLHDFVRAAAFLVKPGGRIAFIHRSERLLPLCDAFRQYHIEPKRLQFIQASEKKSPHLVLLEGRKLAKSGLNILPTHFLS